MKYYEADKEINKIVIFEGTVYNVSEYMPNHPGGEEYLQKNLGKNIDEDFEEAEHTKSARKIFIDLPVVGKMANNTESDDCKTSGSIERKELNM